MANELILIVEDNEKNMKLLRDVLTFKGYETIEAENAEAGIELAIARTPTLILMDIQLPGMSGIEALQVLRKNESTKLIPVIAVTASVMLHSEREVLAAGFAAYQRKPINVLNFLETVRQVLDTHGASVP
jgi:two-component system, cell cycle response regulator DivK